MFSVLRPLLVKHAVSRHGFIEFDTFLIIPSKFTFGIITLSHEWTGVIPGTFTTASLFVCMIDVLKKDRNFQQRFQRLKDPVDTLTLKAVDCILCDLWVILHRTEFHL